MIVLLTAVTAKRLYFEKTLTNTDNDLHKIAVQTSHRPPFKDTISIMSSITINGVIVFLVVWFSIPDVLLFSYSSFLLFLLINH